MNKQPVRTSVRKQLAFVNGAIALGLLVYGWFCLEADWFYIPLRHGGVTFHGTGCVLMVSVLVCCAVLLILLSVRRYLRPSYRGWCDRVQLALAYAAGLVFFATLLSGGSGLSPVWWIPMTILLLSVTLHSWQIEPYLERHGKALSSWTLLGGVVADTAAALMVAKAAKRMPWFLYAQMLLGFLFILTLAFAVVK